MYVSVYVISRHFCLSLMTVCCFLFIMADPFVCLSVCYDRVSARAGTNGRWAAVRSSPSAPFLGACCFLSGADSPIKVSSNLMPAATSGAERAQKRLGTARAAVQGDARRSDGGGAGLTEFL